MNDLELLQSFTRHGEVQAIQLLIERHKRMVFATCLKELKSEADAHDASQQVFMSLMEDAADIHSNVGAWLYRCSVNTATSIIRHRQSRHRHELEHARLHALAWHDPEPFHQDRFEMLDSSLRELRSSDDRLLIQNYVAGTTQKELAASRGVSQQAIAKRVKKVIERLRRSFSTKGLMALAVTTKILVTQRAASALALKSSLAVPTAGSVGLAKVSIAATAVIVTGIVCEQVSQPVRSPDHAVQTSSFVPATNRPLAWHAKSSESVRIPTVGTWSTASSQVTSVSQAVRPCSFSAQPTAADMPAPHPTAYPRSSASCPPVSQPPLASHKPRSVRAMPPPSTAIALLDVSPNASDSSVSDNVATADATTPPISERNRSEHTHDRYHHRHHWANDPSLTDSLVVALPSVLPPDESDIDDDDHFPIIKLPFPFHPFEANDGFMFVFTRLMIKPSPDDLLREASAIILRLNDLPPFMERPPHSGNLFVQDEPPPLAPSLTQTVPEPGTLSVLLSASIPLLLLRPPPRTRQDSNLQPSDS